jgi:cellulose synthase/poly-beta-1,6-N-acetylglucosamine synthase-like glycosyltransferase
MPFTVTVICCLLFAVYCGLISWYHRAWRALPVYSPRGGDGTRPVISVLVPARNEEDNIGSCLQSLAAQRYPRDRFEVIVIDDHSTDSTAAIVKGFGGLPVRYLSLAAMPAAEIIKAHKKFAIESGIGLAAGELIVTTDADCLFEPEWLLTVAKFYQQSGAKFIAAPVRIAGLKDRQSLLTIFQTLDFITLQGITGAAVSRRIHSMCNGANLCYEKKTFGEVGGFRGIDDIPSGDDMLLMHKIALRYPSDVYFLKSRSAIVSTRAENNLKKFFHQRIRWASKADRYDDKRIYWVLLLVYLVNLLFLVLAIGAIWDTWWGFLLVVLLVAKTMVEFPFVSEVASFFGQRKMMIYFPLLQPLHIAYTLIAGWLGKFGSYDWKGRKIGK